MLLTYRCPICGLTNRQRIDDENSTLACANRDWQRNVSHAGADQPANCQICGCGDLWRQKDFPQRVGVMFVATGAILSTIAWYYMYPLVAIGVLLFFAAIDLVLYVVMPDVLVCYRCGGRHRPAKIDDDTPRFDLEVNERYRQEKIRLEESLKAGGGSG